MCVCVCAMDDFENNIKYAKAYVLFIKVIIIITGKILLQPTNLPFFLDFHDFSDVKIGQIHTQMVCQSCDPCKIRTSRATCVQKMHPQILQLKYSNIKKIINRILYTLHNSGLIESVSQSYHMVCSFI